MLTHRDATAVSHAFGLGLAATLKGPMARGQLGRVWRLTTTSGSFAVKEWFEPPELESVHHNAAFSESVRTAGVFTPTVIRTPSGAITADVAGVRVRVFEWVDLGTADRGVDPAAVGQLVARLHRSAPVSTDTVADWFCEGVGADHWHGLLDQARLAGAPFAPAFDALVDDLIAVEEVIEPAERAIICHRDLWADNVLAAADGRLCIIDFENLGPADPSHELAMVLFEFGQDDAARARALYAAYVDADGPGRVTRRGHFTMVAAVQAHLGDLEFSRWIDTNSTDDPIERDRLGDSFGEILGDPVTISRIDRLLTSVA